MDTLLLARSGESGGVDARAESALHGVSANDPLTYIGVALLLGLVAALASYIPARRAARLDPVVALRND